MLKHIKRKTVRPAKIDLEKLKKIFPENVPDDVFSNIKFKDVKGYNAIQLMQDGEVIFSFFYNDNGNACTIPLANPVLIYFNIAQSYLKNISSRRDDLLRLFRNKKDLNEDAMKIFYEFFGLTSSFIVMLMTSIEAFVNQHIDKDYKYEKLEQKKYLKVYDYGQILRWISLEDKIEDILNVKYSKDFADKFPNRYVHFKNLKELRDQIVHTKEGQNHQGYIELFRKTLNFKFNDSIEAARDFMNYYEPNLIEPCPCGVDS